ncbi:hypothetical protein FD01_GL002189 [Lacticaseibacillus manihotivorans DSM 13343 = JCM 12514]|uniref:Uncharacterized protein n=1 Tax=Lacticaseibacillus manihotivorans DSM 13343 = JCM 12514 TaxID=1423769 RepID=A0A0R1QB62_9LACO|nr:hypothetical protein FD01_GL002189 [Lacticaseibacillus manihotivorans DSM 13343 = JCM 12514]
MHGQLFTPPWFCQLDSTHHFSISYPAYEMTLYLLYGVICPEIIHETLTNAYQQGTISSSKLIS